MSEPIAPSAEGLWTGLRRRKVVQWGIAYVAAAWGLLQGLVYLSTVFRWPAQLQRPVTMAFLVDRIPGYKGVTAFSTTQWEPGFPGFRNSRAFKQMLHDMGIPAYWHEHGFPPLCRAVGARDFKCD